MALNLILGEKKSGKTTYILNCIKNKKNCTVIVPEHNLFVYETLILDTLGEAGAFLINTLSFKKLASNLIKDEEEYNKMKLLDNDTRALIVERILLNSKDSMTALKKAVKKPDFSSKIADQITEFKKYLITSKDIENLCENTNLAKSLKEKLSDIGTIYKKYEEQAQAVFKDTDDIITYSAKKIIAEKTYKDKSVYIDGFTGFTKDELFMIEAFLSNGSEVYVSLPYFKEKAKSSTDLYYSVKKTVEKLIAAAEKCETKINEIYFEDDYTSCEEIKFLKKNYSDDDAHYEKEVNDIYIAECKNIMGECRNLVSLIIKNLKKEELRLDDIAVILPDIKKYLKYIEPAFKEFGLSYYCNEKVSVYDLSVAMLLNSLFDIVMAENRLDVILNYLKSGYFYKDCPEKIYKFENFIKQTGIRAYTLMNKPFSDILEEKKKYNFEIDNEEELTEIYDTVIKPVCILKEKLKKEKTALNYSLSLYEYFKEIKLEETILLYAEEYENDGEIIKGNQLIQVYNYIVESMERASLVLSECEISLKEYKDIIICSLKNKNIASIPVLNDSIMLSDLNSFCGNNYKYIYILGANEGKLPDTSFTEGLINEEERSLLSEYGIEMSMNYELKLSETWLKLYDTLISAGKGLYISYPVSDKGGEELIPSQFVRDISDMFGIVPEREDASIISKRELLKETLYDLSINKKVTDSFKYLVKDGEYKKIIENNVKNFDKKTVNDVYISEEKLNKIFKDNLRVSASSLESYRECGYAYFLNSVLRLKEKNAFSINNANLGSLMHGIIEKFSVGLKEDNLTFKEADDNYISEKLDKIISKIVVKSDNGLFITDKKAQFMLKRAKRSATYLINLLKHHFEKGQFEPVGYEVSFGRNNSNLDGVKFELEDGRKIILTGVIDRVDKLLGEDADYIRIVDYKSTGKKVDYYEIFAGLKIQLAVYLIAMLKNDTLNKIKPGGMMYLSLDTPIIKIENALDKENLDIRIKKEYVMRGIFLKNDDVLIAMDNELMEESKSGIIDIAYDKSGIVKGNNTLTLKEFEKMLSHVCDTVKKEGEGILKGDFKIYPALSKEVDACKYCPFISVCMFEGGICENDRIEALLKDKLFEEKEGEEIE